MISGEASIGVTYSGEVLYMTRQNPDLAYVVPDEGSAIWMDGWVIPKNCKQQGKCRGMDRFYVQGRCGTLLILIILHTLRQTRLLRH